MKVESSNMNDPRINQIVEQYDTTQGLQFYQTVMGDGGFNVHYGLYEQETDTMQQATDRLINLLVDQVDSQGISLDGKTLVDLGSGFGGTAHYLAKNFSCQITCVNISEAQNKANKKEAEKIGIAKQLDIIDADFSDLPDAWTGCFDIIWSIDSFCYAPDKKQVFDEISRIIKPGGQIVFTDIMSGDYSSAKDLNSFSDRNAVTELSKVQDYQQLLKTCGFEKIAFTDLTHYLPGNFQRMINQIDSHRNQLVQKGVAEQYLDDFRKSLVDRIKQAEKGIFSWGCFTAQRPYI